MKDFFEKLNALGRPKRSDIIEKDFQLHRLLYQITQDDFLKEMLIFKGGTCLIKGYLDYYRFSEDIDFTWGDDSIWKGLSKSETKKRCSREITGILSHFKDISDNLGLVFSGDKDNFKEVHISSGGRMVFFFVGYSSDILNIPSKIKIEINFVEDLINPTTTRTLKSYIEKINSEELEFLYEKPWNEYNTKINIKCYDTKEIYTEKCRAALTRLRYKLRDIIDLYYLEKKYNYSISKYKSDILKKIRFVMGLYKRYRENLEFIKFPKRDLKDNEELELMLVSPPIKFNEYIKDIHEQLNNIKSEL